MYEDGGEEGVGCWGGERGDFIPGCLVVMVHEVGGEKSGERYPRIISLSLSTPRKAVG